MADVVETPEVAFTGDTTPAWLTDPAAADARAARLLICECTFVDGALPRLPAIPVARRRSALPCWKMTMTPCRSRPPLLAAAECIPDAATPASAREWGHSHLSEIMEHADACAPAQQPRANTPRARRDRRGTISALRVVIAGFRTRRSC